MNENSFENPQCERCETVLGDWSGNIMVPTDDYLLSPSRIETVMVLCKKCTTSLDKSGKGNQWHNLWELSWIRDHPIHYLGRILEAAYSEEPSRRWSYESANKVFGLAAVAHPELSESGTGL